MTPSPYTPLLNFSCQVLSPSLSSRWYGRRRIFSKTSSMDNTQSPKRDNDCDSHQINQQCIVGCIGTQHTFTFGSCRGGILVPFVFMFSLQQCQQSIKNSSAISSCTGAGQLYHLCILAKLSSNVIVSL